MRLIEVAGQRRRGESFTATVRRDRTLNPCGNGGIETDVMSNEGVFSPSCPSCGKQMTLARTAPPVGAPTGLRTYRCVACGVSETRTERQERPPDEDAAKRRRAPLSGGREP